MHICPALAGEREDVAVAKPFGMDRLAALDIGQRAQPVAIDRGELEILLLGRLGHLLAEPRLHAGRLAGEELLRVGDQLGISRLARSARRTAPSSADLVEQARPRAVGEKAVRTAS